MTANTLPLPPGRADLDSVNFPRPLKGFASQHLVVTMLGDYWRESDQWLPSRLLVALAAELGLSTSATSTALSRLATRGVLDQSNAGRTSRYRFTAEARERINIGISLVGEFGSEQRHWDKTWTVFAFTVPESSRELRELLRARLRWLGFAPLYGAVWVSAWDTAADLESSCRHFGLDNYVIFRTSEMQLRGMSPLNAWDLEEQRRQYTPFIDQYRGHYLNSMDADLTGAKAFRLRTEVIDAWRAFPWDDPGLPPELLPADFPLFEARRIFVGLYNSLSDAAAQHAERVVAAVAPELSGTVRAFRVEG